MGIVFAFSLQRKEAGDGRTKSSEGQMICYLPSNYSLGLGFDGRDLWRVFVLSVQPRPPGEGTGLGHPSGHLYFTLCRARGLRVPWSPFLLAFLLNSFGLCSFALWLLFPFCFPI